ncbi:phosphoribosyltransferase [Synechococcus sp. PCC 6312]|uniref:phosphoribosyltransferase n=1 Tax=Synechococcus sp. (strain ATCC 27167 / PCC 6312) TaxID=195253 RepID=UPI00029EDF4B|nr:phosphoribosyltransferase family protein [Synechococcus sp. PCC 6312]AFY59753.1 putative phosphoribosyltransferase [Synechococcus sp. PCC 6312]
MSQALTNAALSSPATDLWVSWDDYHRLIEALAVKIYQSGWEFNQILCLAKGGLRVGDLLSRLFNQPMAILAVSSYGGEGNRVRGSVTFSRDLTMTTPNLGSRVLIVDDLVDSGITMQKSLAWLDRSYGFYVEEVKTAVLWQKACSVFTPNYVVQYLPHNPWIHQPFERYEVLTAQELAAELGLTPVSNQ